MRAQTPHFAMVHSVLCVDPTAQCENVGVVNLCTRLWSPQFEVYSESGPLKQRPLGLIVAALLLTKSFPTSLVGESVLKIER